MTKKEKERLLDIKGEEVVSVVDDEEVRSLVKVAYKWATRGESDKQIAENFNLSKKEFNELCVRYPVIMGALKVGRDYANMLATFSLAELAYGHYMLKRQVLSTVVEEEEYINGDGELKTRQVKKQVPVWIEEEQKPDITAVKFMLEKQMPMTYGKEAITKEEHEIRGVLEGLSPEDVKKLKIIESHKYIQEKKGN